MLQSATLIKSIESWRSPGPGIQVKHTSAPISLAQRWDRRWPWDVSLRWCWMAEANNYCATFEHAFAMASCPCERTTTTSSSININININIIIIIIIIIIMIDTWVVATDELINSSDTLGDLHLPVAQRRAPTWTGHVPGCVVQSLGPKNSREPQHLPAGVAQPRAFDSQHSKCIFQCYSVLTISQLLILCTFALKVWVTASLASCDAVCWTTRIMICSARMNGNFLKKAQASDEWWLSVGGKQLPTCTRLVTTKHVKLRWKHWGGML